MVNKIKHFFKQNTLVTLCLLFLIVFGGAIQVFAVDPPPTPGSGGYASGTVLDPGCIPGSSTDCTVKVGDVVGPSSSIDGDIAIFDGTTGKIIKGANGLNVSGIGSSLYAGLYMFNTAGKSEIAIGGVGDSRNRASFVLRDNPNYNLANQFDIAFSNSNSLDFTFKDSSNNYTGIMSLKNDGAIDIRGQKYYWPLGQTANSFLETDGFGNLSWSTATSPISIVNTSSLFSSSLGAGDSSSATESVFLGLAAGFHESGAYNSNFIGSEAGSASNGAHDSTFIGQWAGADSGGANDSIFLGSHAGYAAGQPHNSIFIGAYAGSSENNGSNDILIGNNTRTGGYTNSIAFGTGATNTKSNQFLVASSYNNWQIAGVDYVMPASDASGVLTSDGSGNLSWAVDDGSGFTIDANSNMFAGTGAGAALTSGTRNLFTGINAGESTTVGSDNTAIGYETLLSNTGGSDNTAIGRAALYSNNTGHHNTAIGRNALALNSTGNNNTANGSFALYSNSTGYLNTAIGYQTLYSNSTGYQNTATGVQALALNSTGNNNTAFGVNSLFSNKTGSGATAIGYNAMLYSNDTTTPFTNYNVAVGYEALRGSTTAADNTGNNNTTLGYQTLYSNTSGSENIANGVYSLFNNTSASKNIAIGYKSLYSQSFDNAGVAWNSNNLAIGYESLFSNQPTSTTNGFNNTAVGSYTLRNNTTGFENTATGYQALFSNTTGDSNLASGEMALFSNTIGYNNTALGTLTMYSNQDGNHNTAVGRSSLYANISGSDNVSIGMGSLGGNTLGSYNVAIGDRSGVTLDGLNKSITGSYNVFLGYASGPSSPTQLDNAIAIGKNALVGASNSMVLGGTGSDAVNVGIGITQPLNIFHVTGTPVARIANTLGGTTQNNGLVILAGNDTGVATSELITFRRPDNTVIGTITQTSATAIGFNSSSDRRIKENINPTSFGLSDLEKIEVSDFNFINDPNKQKMTGFIAQDLYNIFPGAVTTNGDNGTDLLAQGMTPWMIDYSKLSPLIVKSIQELNLKVEDLANINTPLLDVDNNKTFVGLFFDRLVAWLGFSGNNIQKIYTKEICISENECLSEEQLRSLIENYNNIGTTTTIATSSTETSDIGTTTTIATSSTETLSGETSI